MNTEIVIHDRDAAENDHLEAALRVVLRQNAKTAVVYVSPRRNDGWIEYGVRVHYEGGGTIYIAVIQRNHGEPIECHS